MSDADRADLGRWVAERDADAFRAIILRYSGKTYAACRRVLGSAAEAEDACRECFEALARFEETDKVNSLGAWLHGVAVHQCIGHTRTESSRVEGEESFGTEQPPAQELGWSGIAGHIDEAIAELPEIFREPILAHFLEGQSHAAIARVTDTPIRTVSYRIEQGLDRLAKRLERRGVAIPTPALAALLTDNLAHALAVPESLAGALDALVVTHAAPAASAGTPGRSRKGWTVLVAVVAVVAVLWAAQSNRNTETGPPKTAAPPAADASAVATEPAGDASVQPGPGPGEAAPGTESTAADSFGTISGIVQYKTVHYDLSELSSLATASYPAGPGVPDRLLRRVTNEVLGPLPGAPIHLAEWKTVDGSGEQVGRLLEQTVSNERGRFAFTVPPGLYAVWSEVPEGAVLVAERHRSRFLSVEVKAGEDRDYATFSFRFDSVTIEGQVRDAAGSPIAGAEVTAEPFREPPPPMPTGVFDGPWPHAPLAELPGLSTTTTDEGGYYRLEGLMASSLKDAAVFLQRGPLPRKGGTYFVKARCEGYSPARIAVPVIPEPLAETAAAVLDRCAKMGMDTERRMPEYQEVFLPACKGNQISGIDFALQPQAVVSGRLLDSRGNALTQSRIRMVYAQPRERAVFLRLEFPRLIRLDPPPIPLSATGIEPDWVRTGDSGAFRFTGVPAGVFLFETESEAGGAQTARNAPLQVNSGTTIDDLQVVVESVAERGRLTGRVIDTSTNRPVPGAKIHVLRIDSPTEKNPAFGSVRRSDRTLGVFSVEGCSPGVATLWVAAPGYPPVEVQVTVVSGQSRDIVVPLIPEGIVEGHISLNGVPSRGRVDALRVDGVELPHRDGDMRTTLWARVDDQGYYIIQGLPPGDYYIQASAAANAEGSESYRQEWATATVTAGHATRVDFDIAGHAVIRGTLTLPMEYESGRVHLIEGRAEGLTPREPATAFRLRMRASTESLPPGGVFEFTHLPPGTCTLTAFAYRRPESLGTPPPPPAQIWRVVLIAPEQTLDVDLVVEGS